MPAPKVLISDELSPARRARDHRRMVASALGRIRGGGEVTTSAFDHGYESLSGFHEAFRQLFGDPPSRAAAPGAGRSARDWRARRTS